MLPAGSLYIQLSIAIFFISMLIRMTWKFCVCVCVCVLVHASVSYEGSLGQASFQGALFDLIWFFFLSFGICCYHYGWTGANDLEHIPVCVWFFNTIFFFCPQATNLRPIVTEYDSKKRSTKTELALKKWVLQTCSMNRNDVKIKLFKFMIKLEKSGPVVFMGVRVLR